VLVSGSLFKPSQYQFLKDQN